MAHNSDLVFGAKLTFGKQASCLIPLESLFLLHNHSVNEMQSTQTSDEISGILLNQPQLQNRNGTPASFVFCYRPTGADPPQDPAGQRLLSLSPGDRNWHQLTLAAWDVLCNADSELPVVSHQVRLRLSRTEESLKMHKAAEGRGSSWQASMILSYITNLPSVLFLEVIYSLCVGL